MDYKHRKDSIHIPSRRSLRNKNGWKKPVGVIAGFAAFTILCGVVDSRALAMNYTAREPITVLKEVYVDPKPANNKACPIDDLNQYQNLDSLKLDSSLLSAVTPATAPLSSAASASAKTDGDASTQAASVLPAASSYFRQRFESLYIPDRSPAPTPAQAGGANKPASSPQQQSSAQSGVTQAVVDASAAAAAQEDPSNAKAAPPKAEAKEVSINSASGGGFAQMNAWKQKNSDVMGYLRIPGTNIDYPVVQGATNDYYLTLGYDKQYSYDGVIWADQDVRSSSKNTILYGHNWTNFSSNPRVGNPSDVMFAQLTAYQHLSFAQSHPTIQYANANGDGTWVVFATLYTTDLDFYLNANSSPTTLAAKGKSMSLHNFDVDIQNSDQIICLSTCTRYFGKFENQRFVVMARKLREGEKLSSITIS